MAEVRELRRTVFEPGPAKPDLGGIQNVNLRAVLTAVASYPGCTAADICRSSGLSPATVSRLSTDLVDRGLVLEGERVRGKRGQPGVALWMNPEGAYSAGCQIGFGPCHFLVRSLGGEVLAERAFTIARCTSAHVAEAVAAAAEEALAEATIDMDKLVGLGIAVPADFDRLCQQVLDQHEPSWEEAGFRAELARLIDMPISIYSTGSAAAWAELASLPPPRPADYLYLYVDRFLQSGLLLDSRLWSAPQEGHGGLGRAVVAEGGQRLYEVVGGHAWMFEMIKGGRDHEEITQRWVGKAGCALAQAVQGITDTLHLPLVVIDGSLPSGLMDALSQELGSQVSQRCWSEPPRIKRGAAGALAPAKGAALRPLYTSFFAQEGA